MRDSNPYRPPALEPDESWPDPPQVPDPEPPDLLKKSAIAGCVAAVVFGSGTFFALEAVIRVGNMQQTQVAAGVAATLFGLALLAGFVIFRRKLFARRPRRRRRP